MKFPLKRFPKLLMAQLHTRNALAHRVVARFKHLPLDRPIFVVGLPRSGTSIYVRLFSENQHLAHWSEAPVVWDPAWRDPDVDHRWTEEHATEKAVRRIDNNFAYYTKWKGKSRFLNKHPRNALRVPFMVKGWPTACLIHLQRDARAVANSLVERTRKETWRHKFPLGQFARPEGWREINALETDVERFCEMVVACHRTLTDDLARCADPAHLLTIRYEDFATDCRGHFREAWAFCDVPIDEAGLQRVPESLENMNYKWAKNRSREEIEIMHRVLTPILIETGYETSDDWVEPALANAASES